MVKKNFLKNKKGVMSIIESFLAITLIMIVASIIIQQNSSQKQDISEQIYSKEIWILRGIELNDSLRTEVLNASVPVYWTEDSFPSKTKEEITRIKPSYLDCKAKVCNISSSCLIEEEIEKEVYAQSVLISANATLYSPRELKLFCWEK
jgi:hypothetical protein